METRALIESILFVAESPVTTSELAEVLEVPRADVEALLEALADDLTVRDAGVVLRRVGGGWRMFARPEARAYLERFAATESATRLSPAALETLAVVAYKQPVSRGQVSEIRGVDAERAMQTLERRGLVTEIGRDPGPGQAILYGTTTLFLEKLGLDTLAELPPFADHVPSADIVEALERSFRPELTSNESTS